MNILGTILAVALVSFLLLLPSSFALADATSQSTSANDATEWLSAQEELRKRLPALNDEQKCQARWDMIWTWSKRGNMEARSSLLFSIMPPASHAEVMILPGRAGDLVSTLRDAIILLMHSAPVKYEHTAKWEKYAGMYEGYWQDEGIDAFLDEYTSSKFLTCKKNEKSLEEIKNCLSIAVQERIIPAFDTYAEEIEANIARGEKAHCSSSYAKS